MAPRMKLVVNGIFQARVVCDTREQTPYAFDGLRCDEADGGGPLTVEVIRGGLKSGDYSIEGAENIAAVERKSVADLFSTLGQQRDRFERELNRLNQYRMAAVVVEGDWRAILNNYPIELTGLVHAFTYHEQEAAKKGRTLAAGQPPWSRWLAMLAAAMPGPPSHSQLPPKNVFRTINAWEVRYPRVHWHLCPNREFAEVKTFRLLERFIREGGLAHDDDQPPGPPDKPPAGKPIPSGPTRPAPGRSRAKASPAKKEGDVPH